MSLGDVVDLLHCFKRRETAGNQMVRAPKVSLLFFAGCLLLLLNSAFLAAFPSATLWYYANVAIHPVLGIALTLFAVPRILSREWLGGPLLAAGPKFHTRIPYFLPSIANELVNPITPHSAAP